jgi:hypothetical protein
MYGRRRTSFKSLRLIWCGLELRKTVSGVPVFD